jgi:hypothetical protein
MITSWMRAQDRRRGLVAAASTVCLYALAFVGAWLIGSLAPASLAAVPGPVIVDLGGNDAAQGGIPLGLPSAPEAKTQSSLGVAPARLSRTSGTAPADKTQALSASDMAAAQRAAETAAALAAAAASAEAPPGPAKTRTFGSGSPPAGNAPVSTTGTGSEPGAPGGLGGVTFRGSEMGSSLATTFGAPSGQVGRNIYVPIYLYMPLPTRIDESIYRNIQVKETFRSYYREEGSQWVLKSQVPLPQRGDFWTMLEAAGFDASTADFRTERKLSPVVLQFAVSPATNGRVELIDLQLLSSSGSSEIDEAVIYGFRQASFFNKTDNAVEGKFEYSF